LKEKKISVLGASYKGNVGDARESPAKRICAELKKRGARTFIYDPLVDEMDISGWEAETTSFEDAVRDSDCLIIHSDHDIFKELDLAKLSELMNTAAIVDSRGFIDPKEASRLGFLLERI
jgi:UDP-N-acetyl-D-mannosaminuronic acid dehydrogenase